MATETIQPPQSPPGLYKGPDGSNYASKEAYDSYQPGYVPKTGSYQSGDTTRGTTGGFSAYEAGSASMGANATPASLGLSFEESADDKAISEAQNRLLGAYPTKTPDYNTVYRDTVSMFQGQIDALNRAATQKKAEIAANLKPVFEGRLGQDVAIQARRGLIGSDFGAGQTGRIESANQKELQGNYDTVDAETQNRIAALMGQATQFAREDYDKKTAAYRQGAEQTVAYLKERATTRQSNASKMAKAALLQGVDLSKDQATLTRLAQQLGVAPQTLLSLYNDEQKSAEREAAKEAREGAFSLNEGELRYDAQGNLIASGMSKDNRTSNQKDYAFAVENGFTGSFMDFNTADKDGLTPYQKFSATQSLRKELSTNTASARTVQQQYANMKDVYDRFARGEATDLNATTQTIIATFNKILDPNSVIREGEYDRTSQGQSLIANLEGKLLRLQQGGAGINKESLKEVVDLGRVLSENYSNYVQQQNAIISQNAQAYGLDSNLIVPEGGGGTNSNDPLGIRSGFNSGGSAPNNAQPYGPVFKQTASVKKVADAVSSVESGGRYNALGPVVPSGRYKGERALGKYQIMPGNLPQWSKEAIGRVVSPSEFMANPKLQDQIAEYHMSKIYNQYGNAADVASVWHSGRPLSKAGNARDVNISTKQYVQRVMAIYNRTG